MDLNILIEDCGVRDSEQLIRDKIIKCKNLGFNTIAMSVAILIENNKPNVPPPPKLDHLTPSGLRVYTRLSVKVNKMEEFWKLRKCKEYSKYDIIALEPQNPDILQYILKGEVEIDILTFDVTGKFNLFKSNFSKLNEKGVCFEINYAKAQLGSVMRKSVICLGQSLVEKTATNIIISSGVDDIFRLRGPKDAKAIGLLFLLATNKCHDAVHNNPKKVINSAKTRKNPISSAIEPVTMDIS